MYSINVTPGAHYNFRVKPNGQAKALHLEVLDRDLVSLKKGQAPNQGAAVRLEGVSFTYGGKGFVTVKNGHYSGEVEDAYALEVTPEGGAPAPPSLPTAAAAAPGGTSAPAASAASSAAPSTAAETPPSGFSALTIMIAVVGVAVLVGTAFLMGRRSSRRV
jgi:hypothetical protein